MNEGCYLPLSQTHTQGINLYALIFLIQLRNDFVSLLIPKHDVGQPEGCYLPQPRGHQSVLPHDLVPHLVLVFHHVLQQNRLFPLLVPHRFQIELLGQHTPQMLPLEHVPVVHIKRLVLRLGTRSGPHKVLGQQLRVDSVPEARPRDIGPCVHERPPLVLADGRVHAQRAHRVHHTARGEAEDERRPVDGPRQHALPQGRLVHQVLEVVIEVVLLQPGEVLVIGAVVGLVRAVHLGHVSPVILDPCLEGEVLEIGAVGDDRVENVPEH
ncbi:DNA mismatch repair protein MutS [Striga asiatica]|uniref:DNA mismatch repair protein MutS n=1 Tax=Striga asiatica TaxID=4170 RepID=A0A5A7QLU1_STRAF|nr:DNA mismatch repair protein MutS [Striga asiatica]